MRKNVNILSLSTNFFNMVSSSRNTWSHIFFSWILEVQGIITSLEKSIWKHPCNTKSLQPPWVVLAQMEKKIFDDQYMMLSATKNWTNRISQEEAQISNIHKYPILFRLPSRLNIESNQPPIAKNSPVFLLANFSDQIRTQMGKNGLVV